MLYLVATPIGNLGDISLRALETLAAVDWIASEDTRKTGRLLKHYQIDKPQLAFHEHNERQAGPRILALLQEGKSVALVTNAGTPGISDPGFTLVRRVLEANAAGAEIGLTAIPGPAALVMAVVLSGLPVHSFTFRGFSPRKPGARRRFLAVDARSPHTLIFYESPYRLPAFLQDALAVYGDRPAAIANDLTKLYETVMRGRLSELAQALAGRPFKGDYVVVIGGAPAGEVYGADDRLASDEEEKAGSDEPDEPESEEEP
jgi:16S rRNA (cytidine1402-2'-O)-methyltransferase